MTALFTCTTLREKFCTLQKQHSGSVGSALRLPACERSLPKVTLWIDILKES